MTPKLVSRLLEDRRFKNLKVGREDLERLINPPNQSYASFVTSIFDLHGEAAGKRLVGDKTPAYVRSVPTLHDLWPETEFVHIIRDGRDVFLLAQELEQNGQRREPATLPGLRTRRRRQLSGGSGTCAWDRKTANRSVRTTMRSTLREAGLGAHQSVRGALPSSASTTMTPCFDSTRDGAADPDLDKKAAARHGWVEGVGIGDEEVERFEAAGGDLLDELGYPRTVSPPVTTDPRGDLGGSRLVHRDLRSQRHRLPERW